MGVSFFSFLLLWGFPPPLFSLVTPFPSTPSVSGVCVLVCLCVCVGVGVDVGVDVVSVGVGVGVGV